MSAKSDGGGNSRVAMGDWLVRGQFLDPNFNQDTLGKLSSRVVTIKGTNSGESNPNAT
jgi:hypothetical protein